jgi:YVTN family beta-propeller protein
VSPDGHWLYVAIPGYLAVIVTSSQTEEATILTDAAAVYGMVSSSPDSAFAYVTGGIDSSWVTVIDTEAQEVTTPVKVGSSPIGITVRETLTLKTANRRQQLKR